MMVEMAAAMTVTAVILELLLVYRCRFLLDPFARNSPTGICFSTRDTPTGQRQGGSTTQQETPASLPGPLGGHLVVPTF